VDVLKQPHERLSNREFQIMRMIASGKTVTQIARELSLSVKTISTYRTRILEKTAMKTNAELTRYAMQHDLVGEHP
jgi:two-component system invasion response regulator UvrY